MPAEITSEIVQLFTAWCIVATVAIPIGVLAVWWSRARSLPLLPRWSLQHVPWRGFEAMVTIIVILGALPGLMLMLLSASGFFEQLYGPQFPPLPTNELSAVEAAAAIAGLPAAIAQEELQAMAAVLRRLWAGVLVLPVQLGLLILACRRLYPQWHPKVAQPFVPRLGLAVLAWAVFSPLVLGLNVFVIALFSYFGIAYDEHDLTKLTNRPLGDTVLFVIQACVAAPVVEEVVFRGVILFWLVGGPKEAALGKHHVPARAAMVVVAAVLFAALTGNRAPIIFQLLLVLGWLILVVRFRATRRTVGAVYASASLFAAVHSSVWPSPIPLFTLGLVLGWLAVRTRGVLVPAIVHGLFNAVAVVMVLRGGAN